MKVIQLFIARIGLQGAVVLGSLASIFLAGGLREFGIGLFLLSAGALMFIIPSTSSVPRLFWILGVGIIVSSFLSLLTPPDAVSLQFIQITFPKWNGLLTQSVEPITTFFWDIFLLGSILFALYLLSTPLSPNLLRRVSVIMVAGCLAYGLISLLIWRSSWAPPLWLREALPDPVFGLFPNRNHTAGFLLTGAILSAGLLVDAMFAGRIGIVIFGSIAFPVLVSLLLVCSSSRAGLIFLIVGLLIWYFGLGRRKPLWLSAGLVVFAIILAFLFATSGGPLLKRLISTDPAVGGGGPRIELAKDTLEMIKVAPVAGHGMGTFPLIYPQHAKSSLRYATTALHPESDWLLIFYDLGGVAFVLALISLVFCFFLMPKGLDKAEDWPLRWAMASAFLSEILHSFIDVPLHRIELGWWILLLGGFSISGWLASGASPRWQHFVFKAAGLNMMLVSALIFLSIFGLFRALPPFEAARARENVLKMYGVVPFGEAGPVLDECERLLTKYPFNTDLQHQYATFLIQEKTNQEKAKALFTLERKLLPDDGDIVFQQGWILIDEDPAETVSLWKEALSRQTRLDSLPGDPVPRLEELFRNMMQVASEHPSMTGRMGEVASAFPSARLAWISNASCPVSELESAARDKSFMASLSTVQRGRVFNLLWERGDRVALRGILEGYHSAPETIPVMARFLSESGKTEEACRLLITSYSIPIRDIRSPVGKLTTYGREVPTDPLDAAIFYMDHGNFVAARRLLAEAHPGDPAGVTSLQLTRANLAMAEGRWPDALASLMAYLEAKGER